MSTPLHGVLVDHQLQALVGMQLLGTLAAGQVQPASLDLSLGARAWRVQAGILPGRGENYEQRLRPLIMAELDLSQPQLLERGSIYVVELNEHLALGQAVSGTVSPKSSTGRLDIFVRLVTDGATLYDAVPAGYRGKLYLEIMPLTFPIVARRGDKLCQLRLRYGTALCADTELRQRHAASPLIQFDETPLDVEEGMWTTLDVRGNGKPEAIVGYKAKHHTQPVDLAKVGHYDWRQFWEPIRLADCAPLILYPGEFYIMASRERTSVPADVCAELVAYDIRVGELRLHYAGFFDPGWGYLEDQYGALENKGARAVLEVRAHDVPCVLEHGQRLGRFVYEKLAGTPQRLYGSALGSNYAGQGLKLAKQFKMA
jgi:dCTP deaminase